MKKKLITYIEPVAQAVGDTCGRSGGQGRIKVRCLGADTA